MNFFRAAAALWRLTKGYRLRPWKSPYLKWRMETYWGTPAESIRDGDVLRFTWKHRRDLLRLLRWAAAMNAAARARR